MAQAPPCPYCNASSYELRDKRWLMCKECGHEFDLERELCRSCGHLNRVEDTVCAHCQKRLRKDVVDRLIAERGKDRLTWRQERTAIAVDQKKEEEEASRKRMEAYWAQDRARREAQARALAEQREKEKKILVGVCIIAACLVLILVAVVVLRTVVG